MHWMYQQPVQRDHAHWVCEIESLRSDVRWKNNEREIDRWKVRRSHESRNAGCLTTSSFRDRCNKAPGDTYWLLVLGLNWVWMMLRVVNDDVGENGCLLVCCCVSALDEMKSLSLVKCVFRLIWLTLSRTRTFHLLTHATPTLLGNGLGMTNFRSGMIFPTIMPYINT